MAEHRPNCIIRNRYYKIACSQYFSFPTFASSLPFLPLPTLFFLYMPPCASLHPLFIFCSPLPPLLPFASFTTLCFFYCHLPFYHPLFLLPSLVFYHLFLFFTTPCFFTTLCLHYWLCFLYHPLPFYHPLIPLLHYPFASFITSLSIVIP